MSKPVKKAGNAKKKGAAGYKMPAPIPLGTTLTDIAKNKWKVGSSIGTGGFGEIYSACKADSGTKKTADYPFVVKIEPHQNGPLFVEMHFYMRNAKQDDIEKFKKSKGLKSLGMPYFIGNGSEEIAGEKHRFLVMPRYGRDLWSIYLENGKKFPIHTVYRLAIQMLDVLEYVHQCTYVHADLKASNILLGFGKDGNSQAYLVDFGLASHYTTKDFKPDPKKMHNGTIEYTSRDAHQGVPTMRGDLEILAYNLIHWCGNQLPWEGILTNPSKVHESKESHMQNYKKLCKDVPQPIQNYVKFVSGMEYNEQPEYQKLRKIFESAIKELGKTNSGDLEFSLKVAHKKQTKADTVDSPVVKRTSPRRKRPSTDLEQSSPEAVKAKKTKKLHNKKEIVVEESEEEEEEVVEEKPKEKEKPKDKASTKLPPNAASGSVKLKKQTGKPTSKKTYEFNFELDVSFDADVIVNVQRKKKKAKASEQEKENGKDQDQSDEDEEYVPESPKEKKSKGKASRKKSESPQTSPKVVNKPLVRAGEYKGKKAKC